MANKILIENTNRGASNCRTSGIATPLNDIPLEKPIPLDKVAEFLSVSKKTVRRLIAEGKLKAFKIRGSWVVVESDIQSFINCQRAQYGGLNHV